MLGLIGRLEDYLSKEEKQDKMENCHFTKEEIEELKYLSDGMLEDSLRIIRLCQEIEKELDE